MSGTLEELEIQYSQALAKLKARNSFAQQVITEALMFKATRIYSTTNLVHRTATVR